LDIREKILNADDLGREIVEVPEWGVTIEVRGLTGTARGELLENSVDGRGNPKKGFIKTLHPKLVVLCCYDPETGERIFEDADEAAVAAKSGGPIGRLGEVAGRLSGIGEQAVEEEIKN